MHNIVHILCAAGDVFSGNEHGESLHLGVLQEWFGVHWWNARPYALLCIVVLILLPLALYRRVGKLVSSLFQPYTGLLCFCYLVLSRQISQLRDNEFQIRSNHIQFSVDI